MQKTLLSLLGLALIASMQACNTNPSGPGDPVIMASYIDSTLVDVTGTWRLIAEPHGDVIMSISSSSLQWFSKGRSAYSGTVDMTFNRSIVTKRDGVERVGTVYGIRIEDNKWSMAVRNHDSISLGPCDGDPDKAVIEGSYVRVK
jgi:hypothetical protein